GVPVPPMATLPAPGEPEAPLTVLPLLAALFALLFLLLLLLLLHAARNSASAAVPPSAASVLPFRKRRRLFTSALISRCFCRWWAYSCSSSLGRFPMIVASSAVPRVDGSASAPQTRV